MELSPGDIFDAETDPVPENVTAELQRQSYSPRQCELVTRSCDLVSPDPEQFYSLKLAGDHAYLVRDYMRAVTLYEKYLRKVLDNGQQTPPALSMYWYHNSVLRFARFLLFTEHIIHKPLIFARCQMHAWTDPDIY